MMAPHSTTSILHEYLDFTALFSGLSSWLTTPTIIVGSVVLFILWMIIRSRKKKRRRILYSTFEQRYPHLIGSGLIRKMDDDLVELAHQLKKKSRIKINRWLCDKCKISEKKLIAIIGSLRQSRRLGILQILERVQIYRDLMRKMTRLGKGDGLSVQARTRAHNAAAHSNYATAERLLNPNEMFAVSRSTVSYDNRILRAECAAGNALLAKRIQGACEYYENAARLLLGKQYQYHGAAIDLLDKAAQTWLSEGYIENAEAQYHNMLKHVRNMVENGKHGDRAYHELAACYERLGDIYYLGNRHMDARQMYQHALVIRRNMAERNKIRNKDEGQVKVALLLQRLLLVENDPTAISHQISKIQNVLDNTRDPDPVRHKISAYIQRYSKKSN